MKLHACAFRLLLAATLALAGCGSSETTEEAPDTEESPGTLALADLSESAFNPAGADVRFDLQGAKLSTMEGHVAVFLNGEVLNDALALVDGGGVTLPSLLQEGNNQIEIYADDAEGKLLSTAVDLWAGSSSLTVTVKDEGGVPSDALVHATVAEAPKLSITVPTNGGVAELSNVPFHTVLLSAESIDGGAFGTAGAMGGSSVDLRLYRIAAASPIDNNQLGLGTTDGWSTGGAPVTIEPHEEEIGGPAAKAQNFDLVLSTAGEGAQHIARTFAPKAGTKSVSVRYRFVTSEIPGGYFGSEFNDYFSVVLRASSGAQVAESNSMNGLGLAAFDAGGATAWRETTLLLDEGGSTVQVDLSVANVGDGLYDSQLIVDMVAEQELAITKATLRDIDNTALRFLSAAPHTYFAGSTRVHGTLEIKGDKDATINAVELELLQGGAVLARGNLAATARVPLLQKLGDDGAVEVATSQLLFEIPSAQLALLNSATNGDVAMRVRATTAEGGETTRDVGAVPVLALYQGTSRYGGRDATVGGDDWVIPSVASVFSDSGIEVGDISNMNGGKFSPHASHQRGVDADGKLPGYADRDADTAERMLVHLNASYGRRIQLVFVTYEREPGNTFWSTIEDVMLEDGRWAKDVIRPLGNHTTHFHWRVQP